MTRLSHIAMSRSRRSWMQIGLGLCVLPGPFVQAAVFADLAEARRLLLPQADAFVPQDPGLDPPRLAELARLTGRRVPAGFAPQWWRATSAGRPAGWLALDRVIGKYEAIDYAMGFDEQAQASGLEVLAYRESHGGEIRQVAWRRQFKGRRGPAQMRFEEDIRNISGATLSCQHVTEGAQRLAALAQILSASR